jgi:hypothetical protein
MAFLKIPSFSLSCSWALLLHRRQLIKDRGVDHRAGRARCRAPTFGAPPGEGVLVFLRYSMEGSPALTAALVAHPDDGAATSAATAGGQDALVQPPLPEGLSLPSIVGQLLAFLPKWPVMLLQLVVIIEVVCDTDKFVALVDDGASPRRVLSLCAVAWPLLTAVYFSAALTETLCRQ